MSAIKPSPTHRFMPLSPRYMHRRRPCRRFNTLMRPSQPVRHFWPCLNQRFFCSRFRSALWWIDSGCTPASHPCRAQRFHSWLSRMRHRPPPAGECSPAFSHAPQGPVRLSPTCCDQEVCKIATARRRSTGCWPSAPPICNRTVTRFCCSLETSFLTMNGCESAARAEIHCLLSVGSLTT